MANVFRNRLRDVCGMSQPAAVALINQGFNSPSDLVQLDDEGIDNLVKHTLKANATAAAAAVAAGAAAVAPIAYPYRSVVNLKAFRYYAILYERMGLEADAGSFTNDQRDFVLEVMKERSDRKKADKDEPDKPPELKSLENWRSFWEKFESYMSQVYGAAEIPLNYVYREHEDVTQEMRDAEYDTFAERYYMTTVLSGSHYVTDNKRVYDELKALVLNGPGWAFVKRFDRRKNGREAVLALRIQGEGMAAKHTRKQKAYSSIAAARYTGPRRNFTFQDYITKHQDAHNELLDLEEPVSETKKVTDFLAGITDSRLANGKDIVMGTAEYRSNFESCQQYLSSLIATKEEHAKLQRQIAGVGTGSGRGNGNNNGSGLRIHSGNYTLEEWRALGDEGREKVKALRKKNRNKRKAEKKRQLAAVESERAADDEQASGNDADTAQFGRDAHSTSSNKKQKNKK